MLKRLPVFVEPIRNAEKGQSLEGSLTTVDMERLRAMLKKTDAEIEFKLHFGMDDMKQKYIQGIFDAFFIVECQRCMEDMDLRLNSQFKLGLVQAGNESSLSSQYEAFILGDRSIKLASILEDEIILAFPQVAVHSDCGFASRDAQISGHRTGEKSKQATKPYVGGGETSPNDMIENGETSPNGLIENGETSPNPFWVLKKLKKEPK